MFSNTRGIFRGVNELRSKAFQRLFSNGREISIPVPWGVIAGKEWGPPDGTPWLAAHGWLDNCGTFDTLLPDFAKDKRVVAIDYPGHGFSSHIPKGSNYHELESIGYFDRVVKYLGWDKFSFLGHSMGGDMGCTYAAVFPEKIKCLIMLDILGPALSGGFRDPAEVVEATRNAILGSLKMEKKFENATEKVYKSPEDALERLLDAAKAGNGEIPRESAEIILKRGLKQNDNDYSFTRDVRMLSFTKDGTIYGFPRNFKVDLTRGMTMPHLIVKGSYGPVYDSQEHVDEVMETYKQNSNFEIHTVEGGHHVHLTNPERLLPVIDKFIRKHGI